MTGRVKIVGLVTAGLVLLAVGAVAGLTTSAPWWAHVGVSVVGATVWVMGMVRWTRNR